MSWRGSKERDLFLNPALSKMPQAVNCALSLSKKKKKNKINTEGCAKYRCQWHEAVEMLWYPWPGRRLVVGARCPK